MVYDLLNIVLVNDKVYVVFEESGGTVSVKVEVDSSKLHTLGFDNLNKLRSRGSWFGGRKVRVDDLRFVTPNLTVLQVGLRVSRVLNLAEVVDANSVHISVSSVRLERLDCSLVGEIVSDSSVSCMAVFVLQEALHGMVSFIRGIV